MEHNHSKPNRSNLLYVSIGAALTVAVGLGIYFTFSYVIPYEHATHVRCPESYPQAQDYVNATAQFMSSYSKIHPKATIDDMETDRYKLLVAGSCNKTLANMLENVSPLMNPMLRFNNEDFGPQDVLFSHDTNVWSAYYPLASQWDSKNPDEEITFNFYLKNIWKNGPVTAENVAYQDSIMNNPGNITKSQFPDTLTGLPDFSIVSTDIRADQGYGYIYLIKISSVGDSAFSVTYMKKFYGDSYAAIQTEIANWLAADLKSTTSTSVNLFSIGVDSSWSSYLANKTSSGI